jgi:hypothetical protein
MSDDSPPTPPERLPDDVTATVQELDAQNLRRTIIYAQELLRATDTAVTEIETTPNEDILRTTDRDGYTEVVKQVRCADGCEECPHGPYLYHVTSETRPEGGTHTHWKFIGHVHDEDE